VSKQGHLVIFARAPRLGRVKSRLARDIGVLAAWQIYRQISFSLLRRLGRPRRWRCWLALDSRDAMRSANIWPHGWRYVAQGHGDLGQRMARVTRQLPPGRVIIAGSDVPGMDAADIDQAFRALHDKDFVFGPAMDGGYWLIGFKRRPIPHRMFADVRWSSRTALADTLANTGGHRVGYLDLLEDIDSGAALNRWRGGALARSPYRPQHHG
jgi:rSAM/selenodomain-associated transferase 1